MTKNSLSRRTEIDHAADPAHYEARIKASYPIHPELFDRLYEDRSTLERFQRTRGVLRLMSTVVHALWVGQDAGPMILPGSVPLDAPTVTSEITRFFGVYRLNPERYGRDLANLGQEILSQLAAVDGAELEVTVEVHARHPEGFGDDRVRAVLENARTLHYHQANFEDD